MTLVAWESKYSVSIAQIDGQHQRLFGLLNSLYAAMQQGKGKAVMGKVLADLLRYTETHFATEEEMFRKHSYPAQSEHRAEHAKLKAQVEDLAANFEAGKAAVTMDTLRFLRDWLDKHIMGSDQKYVEFLTGKGVR